MWLWQPIPAAAVDDGITQFARFDNTNSFFTGTVSADQFVSQSARHDNTNTFYVGTLGQTIDQTSRFDNASAFYTGAVTGGGVIGGADLLVPMLRRRRR